MLGNKTKKKQLADNHPSTARLARMSARSNNKWNIYKYILASIRLDSPSASVDNREKEGIKQGQIGSLVNTHIRNSASNLMALGQHIRTLRQRRMWNL